MIKYYKVKWSKKIEEAVHNTWIAQHLYVSDLDNVEFAFFTDTTMALISGLEGDDNQPILKLFEQATSDSIPDSAYASLISRMIFPIHSYLHDPVPPGVQIELLLLLFIKPDLKLEYMGRGNDADVAIPIYSFQWAEGSLFTCDIAKGRRQYRFKVRAKDYVSEERDFKGQFGKIIEWFEDPDADVILCLGGGGVKMFAATAFLKIIEALNLKPCIKEVWGSSMGGILGYAFAGGVAPSIVEQWGYDFYNDQISKARLNQSIWQVLGRMIRLRLNGNENKMEGLVSLESILGHVIDDCIDAWNHSNNKIPFYCAATNVGEMKVFGLSVNGAVPENCEHFIKAMEPKAAICATASIPFLFSAHRNIKEGDTYDEWLDASLGEDVPISFAYQKWRNKTDRAKKLKIFYVDSGSKISDFELFRDFEKFLKPFGISDFPWRLVDLMFSSRLHNMKNVLSVHDDVELLGFNLDLEDLSILEMDCIPKLFLDGRKGILLALEEIEKQLKEGKALRRKSVSS